MTEVRPPSTVTNAVSWRSEGVKYRKNEVFLDVVESVDLLVSGTGNVLRSEIVGAIKMRVYLSGMPELRLGLKIEIKLSLLKFFIRFKRQNPVRVNGTNKKEVGRAGRCEISPMRSPFPLRQ